MKSASELMEDLMEEIEGAHHYAEMAMEMHGHPEAEKFREMSAQELGHAKMLAAMLKPMIR